MSNPSYKLNTKINNSNKINDNRDIKTIENILQKNKSLKLLDILNSTAINASQCEKNTLFNNSIDKNIKIGNDVILKKNQNNIKKNYTLKKVINHHLLQVPQK